MKRWSLSLIVGSLLVAPGFAHSAVADPHDLSYEDAKNLFSESFGAEADYAVGSVRLTGFVFKACVQHLEIRKSSSGNRTDFILRDKGNLASCVQEQKRLNPNARFGNTTLFSRLSEVEGSTIRSEGKDLLVGLAWEDTNVDPPKTERRSFADPIQFVSEVTKRTQEQKDVNVIKEEHLERCEATARTARGSEEKEIEALSAIGILIRNGRLDDSEAEELKLQIAKDRLSRLREQASKASADNFEAIDEELSSWAAQFAGDDSSKNDLIAQIRLDMADKMSRDHASSIDIQQATIAIAGDISSLSALSKSKQELALQRLSALKGNLVAAQSASSTLALASMSPIPSDIAQLRHIISLQPEFQTMVMSLQREVSDACTAAARSNGRDRSSAGRCQRAQAVLATEPQRVLTIASQEVVKGLQAMAPQPVNSQPMAPQQPGTPYVPGQAAPGGNTVPYPYSATSQLIPQAPQPMMWR